MVFSLSALWWRRINGLWDLPDGRDWLRGKLGLVLISRAMLSKTLIQFLLMGGAVFPPYCLTWDQTMVEVMKIVATSFKRSHAHTVALSVPDPAAGHCWPTPPPETLGHSQASLGQLLMGLLLPSPGSWCAQHFVCALQGSVPQSCVSSVIKSHWPPKSDFLGVLSLFARSPDWEICCGS